MLVIILSPTKCNLLSDIVHLRTVKWRGLIIGAGGSTRKTNKTINTNQVFVERAGVANSV